MAGEDPGAARGSALAPVALEPAQAMREAIARLMARSKREIPHYYLSNTVDMTAATSWLHQLNRELTVSERIVQAALLLKAAAVAARQVPDLNGYWDNNHRARTGRLRRAELIEATITVTNLGDQGVEAVFGVIYHPRWHWWGSAKSPRSRPR